MRNGWTGGQYSLCRFMFGLVLAAHFATEGPVPAMIPALLFAAGALDRVAAAALLGLLAFHFQLFLAWPLLAHLLLPPAPYLSWAARGRVDPDGGWRMPEGYAPAAWIVLASAYGCSLLAATPVPGLVALHLFAFDPGWVRPRRPAGKEVLLYDGHCGLCHGAVRFVLAEDRDPGTLDFGPLESADSVVVRTPDGALLKRSAAVLHLAARLGGYWRILGTVARIVPRPLRDAAYRGIARVRYRIFGTRDEACPILPEHLRERFLA
ncbi:MAG: thiol-disulfide oxidoreductase DCC family protein [Planctomycetota bacterium]|jgi:predicted DCC family thiol-disulfide oxidoreductase YuxK